MEKKRKLGINTLFPKESLSVSEQIKLIGRVGFDAFFTSWDPQKTEEWANLAASQGLIYQSIHSPFSGEYKVSHMWQEGEDGVFVTNALIDCVKDCARFDIPVMVIHRLS